MRKLWIGTLGFVLAATLSGCGGSGADANLQQQIAVLNEMKTIVESITDDDSAEAAIPRLQQAAARKKELQDKLLGLKISAVEGKTLLDRQKDLISAKTAFVMATLTATQKVPKKAKAISESAGKI